MHPIHAKMLMTVGERERERLKNLLCQTAKLAENTHTHTHTCLMQSNSALRHRYAGFCRGVSSDELPGGGKENPQKDGEMEA